MMMATAALAGLRMLIVEDEAMVAMMLEDQLMEFGCVVVGVAGSVSEGLAKIEIVAPDLDAAVLDVNLGGEKVYPVAEKLTERGVPFIFATGYGTAGIAPAFARVPTLAKPYTPKALEDMLASVTEAARRSDDD